MKAETNTCLFLNSTTFVDHSYFSIKKLCPVGIIERNFCGVGCEGGGGGARILTNQSSKVQNARGVAGGRLKLVIDGHIIDKNE